ncbi:LytR/AlgR family response regulator transcription factor [Plebeiibacterium marinum]|uniref:LytTR family DNA-binding domain-containing protein n=1 Tax=Plebeiibacterium marinum TaxID=2992111 RepID=A0AAE3MEY3_9BACT|nr:LytTR family DNA-binding domain-containing protein [Plebeiobacterium marinum]MCW3806471.1 LytTR family DNA-binding domain-containing protein [Plebeiobacterium marinum]
MRTVIIEDEKALRETNRNLLIGNFPQVEIIGEASSVNDSIALLNSTKPDLVLMDIEIEGGNCFQVLQACRPYSFKVIFITAYNQYAIKAIKFSAIDYILKPVNEFEFCDAINRVIAQIKQEDLLQQTEYFEQQYSTKEKPNKIVLRTSESLHIVNICDITYCKSDNSYTTFYVKNQKPLLVSKSIKEYTELLSGYCFIRPHQSFLVNINEVNRIDKSDGGFIIMNDNQEIPVSKRRKQEVLNDLEKLLV